MTERILVVGATSGIARALCRRFARKGHPLVVAGRDVDELESLAKDLRVRFATDVLTEPFDALAFGEHPDFFKRVIQRSYGELAGVVFCCGYLGSQEDAEKNLKECQLSLDINFTSAASLLHLAADHFEKKRKGFLCVISSVAGDRGRQSNYVYGAAKSALNTFLQGLRNRLAPSGVRVITVKPGFVDTQMTFGRKQSALTVSTDRVAGDIDRAIETRKDVVYTPGFWKLIMLIIRSIPERIFKRLKL